jgi:hypothetical protein
MLDGLFYEAVHVRDLLISSLRLDVLGEIGNGARTEERKPTPHELALESRNRRVDDDLGRQIITSRRKAVELERQERRIARYARDNAVLLRTRQSHRYRAVGRRLLAVRPGGLVRIEMADRNDVAERVTVSVERHAQPSQSAGSRATAARTTGSRSARAITAA